MGMSAMIIIQDQRFKTVLENPANVIIININIRKIKLPLFAGELIISRMSKIFYL